jgi:phage/plasmid-like protein (TIGR03299 family)
MAHNLATVNGKVSLAYVGEKPWHGLGTQCESAMTAEEAIRLGGLDYTVEKRPLFINTPDGSQVEVPNHFSNVRTDTNQPLGVVKNRYTIVQNKDAFGFFDSIIEQGEAIFQTAGALGNGERIFITAKLPEDMLIRGEKVEKYIILTNSHDATTTVIAGFSSVRVICQNTLQAALRNIDNKVSIPHTASADSRLKQASKVMGIASKYMNEVNDIFEGMTYKKLSDLELRNYIEEVMKNDRAVTKDEEKEISARMKKTTDEIYSFALTHATQTTEPAYRTLWGAYNAISGNYNFLKNYTSAEAKMRDMNYGGAAEKISKAFDLAVTML